MSVVCKEQMKESHRADEAWRAAIMPKSIQNRLPYFHLKDIVYWKMMQMINFFRVSSHMKRNELIPVWDFKPAWK